MTEHSGTVGKRMMRGGLLLAVAALVAACSGGSSSTSTAASSATVPAGNTSASVATQPAAGQVSVRSCPTAQAMSGIVGQEVVTSINGARINGIGDDCTVTPLTSLASGSFQVTALDTVNGNATDQMCEDWIIDGQGRPTAVDIQATALGSSSGLSQSAACTVADHVVNLFTGDPR